MERHGFEVSYNTAGIETAFTAVWRSNGATEDVKPILGFLAEYDALSGISQVAGVTEKASLIPGGNGHGCGHNLLGAGSLGAAIAIKNAIEAIKRKKETGSIFISTECEHEWIIIKFKDDGEGISKKEIKKVFKPLYTTKPHGTNWGLGLPFAMKIIKIHMGHMYMESNLGEGTTVSILLPRIAE